MKSSSYSLYRNKAVGILLALMLVFTATFAVSASVADAGYMSCPYSTCASDQTPSSITCTGGKKVKQTISMVVHNGTVVVYNRIGHIDQGGSHFPYQYYSDRTYSQGWHTLMNYYTSATSVTNASVHVDMDWSSYHFDSWDVYNTLTCV